MGNRLAQARELRLRSRTRRAKEEADPARSLGFSMPCVVKLAGNGGPSGPLVGTPQIQGQTGVRGPAGRDWPCALFPAPKHGRYEWREAASLPGSQAPQGNLGRGTTAHLLLRGLPDLSPKLRS